MERNFDFRKRLLEVHQKNRKNEAVFKTIEGVEICLGWQIVYPDDACRLLKYAARDLREYFEVSMDIYLKALPASKSDKNAKRIIITTVDRAPEFKCEYDDASSYRLVVKESQIVVCGTDARGTAQGVYFLEDMMSLNEGPVVSLQNICRRPLYSPRMTHSGFGLDLFPDAHLRVLAHYGYDAILVFTTDINMTPLGFVDFNDLIYRAAGYGIDVYSYSYYHNSMHPDDEGAREYYDDKYGRLFAECPGLKGIVFVGESMEFPSRDEHTNGVPRHMTPGKINRDGRPFPGWYPCNDYPQWISMVRDVIRDKNPEADIVFWTYNWGYVNREARLELIRNLPTDISLQATFEMFEQFHISDTVTVRCVDYTLFFEGPGLYFASEAEEAHKRGIRLYTMSNTGGLTWDFGVIPYEPAPYQWKRRYEGLRRSHDDWGLCGLMECHHYGLYPSFVSELHNGQSWEPELDFDEHIKRIAARDFGKENVENVLRAWELFSDGIRKYIPTNEDQYGPFRIGPAYPLLMEKDVNIPTVSYAMHGGNRICHPMYRYDITNPDKINYEIQSLTEMLELYSDGLELLYDVLQRVEASKFEEAERMYNLIRFMVNSIKTTINVKRWHILKTSLAESCDDEKIVSMLKIAKDELLNAFDTIPLVELDSRLGYEPSMEYIGDKSHIEWKIKVTREAVENELLPLLKDKSIAEGIW